MIREAEGVGPLKRALAGLRKTSVRDVLLRGL